MRRIVRVAAFILACAWAIPAQADITLGSIPGLERELISIPIYPRQTEPNVVGFLEAGLVRPAGPGRYPLIVWSHGAPRDSSERRRMNPNVSGHIAIQFALRGFAVVTVVRRGYGRSSGPYSEGNGLCENPDYKSAATASAQDLSAALDYLRRQRYVEPNKIVLAGASAGAYASLAAANLSGVLGVLNLAGGRGSISDDDVCGEERLVEAFGDLGRLGGATPSLWLYAQNDRYFGPNLARRFYSAYQNSGGRGQFTMLPAFGEDGHAMSTHEGVSQWMPLAEAFLRGLGLAVEARVTPVIPMLSPLPAWSVKSREEFDRYRASLSFEKALILGRDGRFVWRSGYRTPEEAIQDLMLACDLISEECRPYAINNTLVK